MPVRPGPLRLRVAFTPPTGQHLDDRWGDPTRLVVSASPPDLLAAGDGDGPALARDLVLAPGVGAGVLHVSAQAAACDGDPTTGEAPEHAACHLYQQGWGIPLELTGTVGEGAEWDEQGELLLDLRGG